MKLQEVPPALVIETYVSRALATSHGKPALKHRGRKKTIADNEIGDFVWMAPVSLLGAQKVMVEGCSDLHGKAHFHRKCLGQRGDTQHMAGDNV